MRVPNLWPFQLPVLDPVANSGQGCQRPAARRVQPLPAARAGVARGPHDGVRIYRLPRPTGTGSLPQRPDNRARGATRQPLMGDDNRSPGGRQRPELDQAPAGVPRRGVVTDLPVAHRHDRDATELGRRWHLARAADAGGERRVLATTLALGIAAAAHSCEIVEGTEVSKWW